MPIAGTDTHRTYTPDVGDPAVASWGAAIAEATIQRFVSEAERDTLWTDVPLHALCITENNGILWSYNGGWFRVLRLTEASAMPAGVMLPYFGSAAPIGWLLMGQTIANADTSYPSLWAISPAAWKSGTTLTLPSMADRVPVGKTSSSVLGANRGSSSVTLVGVNIPRHAHSIKHDHPQFNSGNNTSIDHDHSAFSGAAYSFFVRRATGGSVSIATNPGTELWHDDPFTDTSNPIHTHPINVPEFVGNSGSWPSQASPNPVALPIAPSVVVSYIIKAH